MDVAVGEHVHVTSAGLVEVLATRRGGVGDRGGHRHTDAQHLVAGGHTGGGAVADDHPGRPGAHQVQGGAVVEHAAGDHRYVQLGDEGLEVQRFAAVVALRHPFGGDDGALDHQQVHPGGQQRRGERLGVLRAHPHGGDHTRIAHPGDGGAEQIEIQRLGVQLLQQPDRRRRVVLGLGGLDHAGDLLLDVGVTADQALAVEHPEAAEAAHLDGELR